MLRFHLIFSKKILLTFVLALLSTTVSAESSLERVSLQLNWKYQFEFAGYIAAKEKGFYEDIGLDVTLLEYQNDIDILHNVLMRKTNYAVSDFSVFIRNKKIIPVEFLATYIQHSPLILLTSKEISSPHELLGKKIMMPALELENSAASLLFSHFYLTKHNTQFIPPSFDVDALIHKEVDAMYPYSTNEPFQLKQKNAEFNIINPEDYGYASPVGNLYTSPEEAKLHPQRTARFVEASTKGWEYAVAHPEEIIQLIIKKYHPNKSIEALRFEANEVIKLMATDKIKVGKINNQARMNFVKQLKRSGLLEEDQHLVISTTKGIFTLEQIHYFNEKQVIKICVDPAWLPLEAIQNDKHIGISADVMSLIQQQLPIPIKLISTQSWQQSLLKAQARQCDILPLAAETPSRSVYMDFTTPYINLPMVLVTKMNTFFINDIAEVKDKKIGIIKGSAIAEQLRLEIDEMTIIDVDSIEQGLSLVERGELFGYIDNLMVTGNIIQKKYTGALKVSARLDNPIQLAIATRNDEPILNEIFETQLNRIAPADLQTIYNSWVAVKQDPIIDYSALRKAIGILLLITLAYVFHYLKLKKLNAQLHILSITDKLTGLYNRVKIDEILSNKKLELDKYNHPFSLILIDIDFFKQINDDYGHVFGDQVLLQVADTLKANVNQADAVGRWGGEEFLILCPHTRLATATQLAKRLQTKVKDVTFSAGVFEFKQNMSIEEGLKKVDEALYLSKKSGRNKVTALN